MLSPTSTSIPLPAPSLLNETGAFTIATSGSGYLGFFFHGDDDFINRCINLCVNYGMLQTGKVHSFHDGSRYILTPASRLHSGLKQYFTNQIIVENPPEICKFVVYGENDGEDVGAAVDVKWDEEKVNKLASERLEEFLKTKVEYKNLLEYEGGCQNGLEFGFGTINEMKSEPITE